MAGTKVRGITIELGADTSGITKALKGVNSEINKTQKELKDVERLLKLDPKNTELLEQKQRLLGERIGETKTKLEALKKAQEQVGEELEKTGKGQEQYDALTREIASCTVELESLEKQASKSHAVLEKIGQAGEKMQDLGSNIEKAGQKLKYVSAAAAGLLTGIVKTTADFDSAMSKVAAISGAAGDEFDALREKAREMGATTKFTATESAEAMNYMAMAGWKTDQMLEGISGVMNLAAASGEDLATTSDIVTDALTAFGLTAEDSAHFADILASAAANANTNVAMMGESFKYAAPVAGSLGYSAEDVALALGLMANSGIKASMAGTSLRNMFNRMAKPTKESEAAMARLGITLQDDEGNMYSFRDIMNKLRKSFVKINIPLEEYNRRLDELDEALENGDIKQKQYNKELEELNKQAFNAEGAEKARAAAMLGGTRAMAGLLAITNASEEDYQKLADAIDNSSQAFVRTKDGVVPLNEALASGAEILEQYDGSAAAMAATMQDNTSGQMEILKSQVQELAISLGDTLTPVLRDLISVLQEYADELNGMDDEQKKGIVNALLFAAALSPVLSILGKLVSIGGSAAKVISAIGVGWSAVVALWAAAIALIVTDTYLIITSLEELRDGTGDVIEGITDFFTGLGEIIAEKFTFMDDTIRAFWEGFGSVVGDAFGVIEQYMVMYGDILTGNWGEMWENMKVTGMAEIDAFLDAFRTFANTVLGIVNDVIDGINKLFDLDLSHVPLIKNINLVDEYVKKKTQSGINTWTDPRFHYKGGMAEGGTISSGYALVGEAGPEILTVANGSATVTPLSGGSNSGIAGLLETYLPYLAAGNTIVMDSGALVGSIAPDMNAALGTIAIRGGKR